MDRHEQEQNTLAYYDHQAQEHLHFRGEGISQYWSVELARFQELLPQGSVLEVGCGTGNEAILLRNMGYDYLGTDLSLGMLSVAQSRCPEANFVCQDLRSLSLDKKFDGLVAIASLLHLEKDEITPALNSLRQQLRSGGIGFLTLKEGENTEIDGKGRFYSYYSPEELAQYLVDSGFDIVDITIHEEKGHNYICCFVENP
jgi:SAM-dependent methyltransferase